MADNSAALAAMLMAQQGRPAQQYDPFARQRRYAEALMTQGASTTPVQSPLEGIARALTGGVGGFFAGQADRDEKEQRQNTTSGLLEYANATALPGNTPEQIASRSTAMAAAQEKLKGADPSIVGALAAQLIGQNASAARGAAQFNAVGPVGGGAPAAPAPSGSSAPGAPPANIGAFLQTMSPQARTASQATGLDPRVVLAQAAIETGYGQAAPGNNFFGVKGPGQILNTMEAGPNGQLVPTQASFKTYGSPSESTADYVKVMQQPNMAGVLQAPGMTGQIAALGKSGYATDPQYAQKVGAIASQLSPVDPTDAASAFTMGRPGLATTASGTQINPSAQPPPFVQPQPQVAQAPGTPPVTVQATPPPAARTAAPEISPQARELDEMAQRLAAQGRGEEATAMRMKAHEAQAAYVAERSKTEDARRFSQEEARKTAATNAEHDRRQAIDEANKPPTEYQAKSAKFADRMILNNSKIDPLEEEGTSGRARILDMVPGGNYAQTPEYRQFYGAKQNWIMALLRDESGASIGTKEYVDADEQYFPRPGDDAQTIADKKQRRNVAVEGMVKEAGSKYKPDREALTKTVGPAAASGPPEAAVSQLKANPGTAAQFDEVFGPGSSAKVLGR